MTDRQIKAMAEAIEREIDVEETLLADPTTIKRLRATRCAKAAFEASDAKYVPMLVEAFTPLMRVTSRYLRNNDDPVGRQILAVAQMAIEKLPEEYR